MKITSDKIVDWLIPAILAGNMHLLSSLRDHVVLVSEQLASLTARLNEHERRLNSLPGRP